ncbi:hypothetical protein CCR97_26285 [Rhodoplanes elegans]|uniref:Uncharacterized protein n=1 Tax=Rhodoplanes elegans TaxID=29408 RepID=A0A327JT48_9BRAD|nr:hypothetical protein [Rhodoplanes elegans]RAI29669.1 hypothetical protein CH338_28435 [Rhodoplanes elegans]
MKTAPGWREPAFGLPRSALPLAALSAAVTVPLALFAWVLPTSIVMSAFALLAVVMAAALAVADRISGPPRRTDRPTLRDIAGAFALAAATATVLADIDGTARWLGL